MALPTQAKQHDKITLKDKETIKGVLLSEDADWVVIQTDDSDVKVRMADVSRISLERQK